MNTPIADELWLDRQDLVDIGSVVDEMVRHVQADQTPIRITKPVLLRGIPVQGDRGNRPVTAESITACYSVPKIQGSRGSIRLSPFPLKVEDAEPLKANLGLFRCMMRSVLAHELTHVRQREFGGGDLAPDLAAAAALSEAAEASGKFADYIDYVSHPVECAAHGTQIAVEVIDNAGFGLDRLAFDTACEGARLWRHVRDHSRFISGNQDRTRLFASLVPRLRDDGWRAYQRLTL